MASINGKVVLVTGASSGIGRAATRALKAQGLSSTRRRDARRGWPASKRRACEPSRST